MFRTSLNDGLSSTSIPSLLEHYGRNQLPEPPKPSILMMIFNQLKDFIVVMLLVFSIVTGAKQDFKGMGVLLFVVVLNTLIGFIQEFKANKALEALQKLTVPKVCGLINIFFLIIKSQLTHTYSHSGKSG